MRAQRRQPDALLFARCRCMHKKITFSLITNKGVEVGVGGAGGHTVGAIGGQQGCQGPSPCSREGARGD